MKLTTFILMIALAQVSARGFGQKITLNEINAPIEKILQSIKSQSGYGFIYNVKDLDNRKITLKLKDATIEEAVKSLTKDLQLSYKIVSKDIVLTREEPSFLDKIKSAFADRDVRGRVVDEQGNPMPNASIQIKGTSKATTSNDKGEFVIKDVADDAVLVISYVGYKQLELSVRGAVMPLDIKLNQVTGELEEVNVEYSTGYQKIPKERATGSFEFIDNSMINRSVGDKILDRIKNLTAGVSINPVGVDPLIIRGRYSMELDVSPLIVLDNFPYDGNINNINPNDVENITILKDAAAASIWGSRAGNGVIVITTKRGKGGKPSVSTNQNVIVQPRPDLYNTSSISASDYIDLEKFLFTKGQYNILELLNNLNIARSPFTPVVELLLAERKGLISSNEVTNKINSFRSIDAREDIKKYFYQTSLRQQHAVNLSGDTQYLNYYFSAGLDNARLSLLGNSTNRVTIQSQNTIKVTSKVNINLGLSYVNNSTYIGSNRGEFITAGQKSFLYPYADLASNSGEALALVQQYRQMYIDTVGNGRLMDWTYKPLNDIQATVTRDIKKDFTIRAGLDIVLTPTLKANVQYQNQSLVGGGNTNYSLESYHTRNLINMFTQVGQDGHLSYPIPKGDILETNNSQLISHQGRVGLSYNEKLGKRHEIVAIAGAEIKDLNQKNISGIYYGYKEKGSFVSSNLNYTNSYKMYYSPVNTNQIPYKESIGETTDRFVSYFANFAYTYAGKLTFSASGRSDAANLFGAKTNKQRGVPLWSLGTSWAVSNEDFYNINWMPLLNFRVTYGSGGNISRRTTAVVTIVEKPSDVTLFPTATILNPPNERLRWEQVKTFNVSANFGLFKNRITGTLDFYLKKSTDVMATFPVDPTLGVGNTLSANVAGVKGQGLEVVLDSRNTDGVVKWSTRFLFSTSNSKLTKWLMPVSNTGQTYLSSGGVVPILGKSLYGLYTYKAGPLDPNTGDPQGYVGNALSKDYEALMRDVTLDSLKYNGSREPIYSGSIMNTFRWKSLCLSFNISYKLGYYFQRNSINYTTLITQWGGHGDYSKRWQKPGDEKNTDVPSFVYPIDPNRSEFYLNSSSLVERADHIRLEDVKLEYVITKALWKSMPFKTINLYAYSQVNMLMWNASKKDIDPYYDNISRPSKTFSIGLNITL
ncbi:SusC/RagA family TonB-linked outer membrane protein [Pedobacter africanus]|nr:SusC/RagA family TonB-linked outer membrane protein [Pedobacter africanus]